eukprot:scaffold20810_cov94-Skeletonema_dohrnii-CCMP3373.AAC.1
MSNGHAAIKVLLVLSVTVMNISSNLVLLGFFLSSCMKQARSHSFKPSNHSGDDCPAFEDGILLDHLTSFSSLGYNNTTVFRLPKSSKTFGLNNPDNYCKVAQIILGNIKSTKLISSVETNFQDIGDSSAPSCCDDSREMSYLVHQYVGAATIGGINETVS